MGPIARRLIGFRPSLTDALVVESGIYSPGDMRIIGGMVQPDIAIVTVVGLEHTSSFRHREDVAWEKGELVAAVRPTGTAILNGDDPHVRGMAERCRGKVIFFGRCEDATLRLHGIEYDFPEGLTLDLAWRGERFVVRCPLVGKQWVPSILGPLAAALVLGLDRSRCAEVLASVESPFNRMSIHPTPAGRTFILDAYKAAHWQIEATLSFLDDVTAPRKTVVFGNISDRWGSSRSRYYAAARAALKSVDRVIFVGPSSSYVRRMLDRPEGEQVEMIPSFAAAMRRLADDVVPGEVIYVKASNRSKLARLMHADFMTVSCLRDECDYSHHCKICSRLSPSMPPPLSPKSPRIA